MRTENFLQRQKRLVFNLRNLVWKESDHNKISIKRFGFNSLVSDRFENIENTYLQQDSKIEENYHFTYDVFVPKNRKDHQSAILLLHGLNERSWDKYLQWAYYLAVNTGKPVILFPIAFHMNRSPSSWANPRIMKWWIEKRRQNYGVINSLSFANVALSNRLSDEPYRFYSAGRQTINDLVILARQMRDGQHPLFRKGAILDILGYSIGSFLAEILLMANPEDLFAHSRLFIFCGGSIFRQMYGTSRYIMDEKAYNRLFNYYCNDWLTEKNDFCKNIEDTDTLQQAFNAMISSDIGRGRRESFFNSSVNRISGISLQKDTVMPYKGVEACMGQQTAKRCFEVLDFPFDYTHETPFPLNEKIDNRTLKNSFQRVFRKCSAYLA